MEEMEVGERTGSRPTFRATPAPPLTSHLPTRRPLHCSSSARPTTRGRPRPRHDPRAQPATRGQPRPHPSRARLPQRRRRSLSHRPADHPPPGPRRAPRSRRPPRAPPRRPARPGGHLTPGPPTAGTAGGTPHAPTTRLGTGQPTAPNENDGWRSSAPDPIPHVPPLRPGRHRRHGPRPRPRRHRPHRLDLPPRPLYRACNDRAGSRHGHARRHRPRAGTASPAAPQTPPRTRCPDCSRPLCALRPGAVNANCW
jgi:hypothetical protein